MERNRKAYHADKGRTDVPRNNDNMVNTRTVKTKTVETITTETRTVQTGTGENKTVETKTVRTKAYETETTESHGEGIEIIESSAAEGEERNAKKAEPKSKTGKKRKKREKVKRAFIKGVKYVLALFVITIILTIIFEKIRFGQVIGKWLAIIMPLLGVAKFLICYIDNFFRASTGKSILDFIVEHEDSFIVEILKLFYQIFEAVCKSILKCFGIKDFPKLKLRHGVMLVVILSVACMGSENHICVKAAEKFITFFQSDEENSYMKPENSQGILGTSAVHSKTTSEEKVNDDIENSQNEESLNILTEEIINRFDSGNDLESEDIIVTEYDRNLELNLSASHYNDIFHLEGEFAIEDWSDQEAIDEVVLAMVRDENSQQKKNKFDEKEIEEGHEDNNDGGNVLSKLWSRVSAASESEKKENTFSGRAEIMKTRMEAYDSHPKSTLAKLVSNDNQALALALAQNGGKKQTKMYYYGESILWGREYIGFADVSASSIKEKLNWIAERYKDIRFICSESDPEYIYADRLMKAYQHAANEF